MEDTSEQSHPERTIITPKHLRSRVWKYFGFHTTDGKVTNKDEAVCRLCTKQPSYSAKTSKVQTHLLSSQLSEAAEATQTNGATSSVQPHQTAYH